MTLIPFLRLSALLAVFFCLWIENDCKKFCPCQGERGDGGSHESENARAKDLLRDKKLEEVGFTVLRFGSWEVLNRMTDVYMIP